jgi:hypothetical protein
VLSEHRPTQVVLLDPGNAAAQSVPEMLRDRRLTRGGVAPEGSPIASQSCRPRQHDSCEAPTATADAQRLGQLSLQDRADCPCPTRARWVSDRQLQTVNHEQAPQAMTCCIRAGQQTGVLAFQASHAGSIPVARSTPKLQLSRTTNDATDLDHGAFRRLRAGSSVTPVSAAAPARAALWLDAVATRSADAGPWAAGHHSGFGKRRGGIDRGGTAHYPHALCPCRTGSST